jgi:cytochrome b
VVALLLCLMVQAATGLFADDAILTQGPLADKVSPATSKLLTGIHELNAKILYALIAVHLAAITYYAIVPRENLVRAMITGSKPLPAGLAGDDRFVNPLRAVALLLLAAAVVWWVVDR